ncbi:maltose acetyltransferase domain-containing protein [Paraburkholderia sp. HD33-4]|nr:maltose acetyltransferase domain-containing protein [Paraburkholderia sp. HD33-4]
MLAGELYPVSAPEIQADRAPARAQTARFKAAHIPLEL